MKAAASSCRRVGGLTSSHWNTHVHQHNVLWSFVRERSHSSGSCMEPYNSRRTVLCNVVFIDFTFWTSLASCLVRFLYLCNESNKMLQMCSFWSWVIRHMEQSGFHHLCFSFHLFCVFGGFWTGNCQLGTAYQGDCSDASSQEEGEKKQLSGPRFFLVFLFLGGAGCFSMILVAVQHDEGRSAWKCVNRWLRSDCGHWQNKGMAS